MEQNHHEQNISLEIDEAEKYQLKTCCGPRSDSRLLVFSASLLLSTIVLIFSCVQLMRLDDCNHQNLYVGVITLILGLWLKSPADMGSSNP